MDQLYLRARITRKLQEVQVLLYRLTHSYQGCGHADCGVSHNIAEDLSFGSGHLDEYGFWENPCSTNAREWERRFPQDKPCWPYTEEELSKMNLGPSNIT